jgi:hypothetical protein
MPITRKTALLNSIAGGESANITPITREEQYLSYIAGESNSYPSEPITREEMYLDKIAKSGVSGGGSGINVQSLNVTENGTYRAPSGVAYSPIFVDVETEEIPTQEKTVEITENGTTEIKADEGYLLSKATVNVNVASSGGGENKLAKLVDRSITEVTAEDLQGAVRIGAYAFYKNTAIKNITLPNGLIDINESAFEGCTGLKSITIPDDTQKIYNKAFTSCSNLKEIHIGSFENWNKITFDYSSANPISVVKSLYIGGELLTNLVIPNTITNIAKFTLYMCQSLKSLTIPEGVTEIGEKAFAYSNIEGELIIPNSVNKIYTGAFESCKYITSLIIGNGLTSIPSDAFRDCSAVTDITIGESVTSISSNAFYGCKATQRVKILATTPPTIQSNTFYNVPSTCIYEVPAASVETYKAATNWSKYASQIVASEEF